MVRSLMLLLRSLFAGRNSHVGAGEAVTATAPVDPSLTPLDLAVLSMGTYAVVDRATLEDMPLRQAA